VAAADVRIRRALAALKAAANRTGEPLGLVEPTDARERMLMLYREWVRCRPHQVHLKACVERAMVRCRTRIEMGLHR
jgi:hypothetical protein